MNKSNNRRRQDTQIENPKSSNRSLRRMSLSEKSWSKRMVVEGSAPLQLMTSMRPKLIEKCSAMPCRKKPT